jgi:hypothetical protein
MTSCLIILLHKRGQIKGCGAVSSASKKIMNGFRFLKTYPQGGFWGLVKNYKYGDNRIH